MSRWTHSDTYCPIPLIGRRDGRQWRCKCGRLWKLEKAYYQWHVTLLEGVD